MFKRYACFPVRVDAGSALFAQSDHTFEFHQRREQIRIDHAQLVALIGSGLDKRTRAGFGGSGSWCMHDFAHDVGGPG
ncbi:MAG TPA: hypothetical protein VGM15_03080 [Burkholderiaceae bacterium]